MREIRTSSSMRGHWKRATAQRACVPLYARPLAGFGAAPRPHALRAGPQHSASSGRPWLPILPPTNGRLNNGPVDRGPLSLFMANSSERRRFVKGGGPRRRNP